MAANKREQAKPLQADTHKYRRIGHKGADAITRGNTIDSFIAAVDHGVDMVELDVLRAREGRLVIAHDPHDALARRPFDLTEALDAFLEKPLDEVEIDCDLKLKGREAELAGALAGRGLLERAMVSTMEIESLMKLRRLEPDLRLGWTYPKTRRDWASYGWARAGVSTALAALRRRFPAILASKAPELDIDAVWVYHGVITPRLVEAANQLGIELIAWTVDDAPRIRELIEWGVHGVCSNDPRLFEVAERAPQPEAELEPEEGKPSRSERLRAKKDAKQAAKEEKKAAKQAAKQQKAEEAG
jgi:glycerophosphoryl diester phosphodiesterase